VIGDPVRHSLSPVLHNSAFAALDLDWAYLALPVREGEAPGAIAGVRALGIDGLSVTMPHKAAVVALMDSLSPVASALGALNTVVRRGSALVGDNTDGPGFLDSLRIDQGIDPAGMRAVVLGAGGAARAVVLALAGAGAEQVVVVNRSPQRGLAAAELSGLVGNEGRAIDASDLAAVSEEVGRADLVVNATPVGMDGTAAVIAMGSRRADLPLDPDLLRPGQVVVDLVYHPIVTPLMDEARQRGAMVVGGLGMLVHQAAHQFSLWTGQEAPLAVMSAAALGALQHPPTS
jgi:shikimate dehydrogenase